MGVCSDSIGRPGKEVKNRNTDREWERYRLTNKSDEQKLEESQEALYRALYGHACAIIWLELQQSNPDIAADAVWKAFKNLEGFQGKSAFSTWFHRIVLNTITSAKRTDKRLAEVGLDRVIKEAGTSIDFDGSRLFKQLEGHLTPEERVLWDLKLNGVTEGAAASRLGLTPAGVRSRWFRLRKKLVRLID